MDQRSCDVAERGVGVDGLGVLDHVFEEGICAVLESLGGFVSWWLCLGVHKL